MSKKRRFRIEAGRYGGELVIGEIDKDFVEYFVDKDETDLPGTIQSYEWDDEEMGDKNAPKLKNFSYWSECDDKEHVNGIYSDAGFFVSEVPADGSDDESNDEKEYKIEGYHLYGREAYHEESNLSSLENRSNYNPDEWVPVLSFLASEKGFFGCWYVETDGEDFDENKFAFSTVETNLAAIVETVWYDKVELEYDQDSYSTETKSSSASVGYFNKKWHDTGASYDGIDIWEGYDDRLKEKQEK